MIAPEELVPELVRLARRHDEVGVLERDAMTRPVTIVPAPAAKGLEFDAVVVVEPAAIAGDGSPRAPAALRRDDPAHPAPEHRPRPPPARPPPRLIAALPSPTILMAWTSTGKVALITGGKQRHRRGRGPTSRRHGAHTSCSPTSTTPGARRVADELEGRFVHTDVADPAASTAAVAAAVDAFGGLHIAHLNAGVTSWCGMGDDFDPEAYRRSMAINLDGVVYGIAAARPAIKASGGGTIVATASMAGLVAAPFDPIYAANKHAVVGLARSLGQVYAPDGIRIHALCPSFAYTNIIKGSEQTLLDMGFPHHRRRRRRRRVPAHPRLRDDRPVLVRRGRAARASPSSSDAPRGRGSTDLPRRPLPSELRGASLEARRRWVPPGARPEPPIRHG